MQTGFWISGFCEIPRNTNIGIACFSLPCYRDLARSQHSTFHQLRIFPSYWLLYTRSLYPVSMTTNGLLSVVLTIPKSIRPVSIHKWMIKTFEALTLDWCRSRHRSDSVTHFPLWCLLNIATMFELSFA